MIAFTNIDMGLLLFFTAVGIFAIFFYLSSREVLKK